MAININSLFDLYSQVFGAHMTVDAVGTEIRTNNNKSWEAL